MTEQLSQRDARWTAIGQARPEFRQLGVYGLVQRLLNRSPDADRQLGRRNAGAQQGVGSRHR